MNAVEILFAKNDMTVELEGLHEWETGEWVNDATVAITLKDATGAQVAGQTWPALMNHVEGSAGTYRANLAAGLSLVPNGRYTAVVSATQPAGFTAEWELDCVCRIRRA